MAPKQASGTGRGRPAGSKNKPKPKPTTSRPSTTAPESSNPFTSDSDDAVEVLSSPAHQSTTNKRRRAAQDDGEEEEEPPEKSIPPALITRMLHEFFVKDATRISRDANGAVVKYVDVFVREAIARAVRESRGGFLEVEDLEKVAPQILLDLG